MDQLAQENWQRYEYAKWRGHLDYLAQAHKCDRFYLGGGLQWQDVDRLKLEEDRRPCLEFNEIMPAVDSAIGYQIQNRMEIGLKPRGGMADQVGSDLLQKVIKQVADQNKLHFIETQVFGDGLIEQRGYFDVRMNFNNVIPGECAIISMDPRDVVPDPDAKTYEPEGWSDVLTTRWPTLDEIEDLYGSEARNEVEQSAVDDRHERDFGEEDNDVIRNKFGTIRAGYGWDYTWAGGPVRRVRIIERQKYKHQMGLVLIYPQTGDIKPIPTDTPREHLALWESQGLVVSRRVVKAVQWSVSTWGTVLHDDVSPYPWFTIVPFFNRFRRGLTRGMVDNGIGPQETLNKSVSQYVHIVNTMANSGWMVQQNSLSNMRTEDLEEDGAKSGLVLEYKVGANKPEKIKPNDVPQGIDKMIDRASAQIKEVTVPDSMRGVGGADQAGVAIQHKQFASQQQQAPSHDNLARTRHGLASRILWCIQNYYTDERVFRITETDPKTGKDNTTELVVNKYDPVSGNYLNDLTVGDYDVVITEQPMAVTFENSQYQQALDMKKAGVAVPDAVIVKHSTLTDKPGILEQMQKPTPPDPLTAAKIALTMAQVDDVKADAVEKAVEAMFSGIRTAQTIAAIPQTAPLADQLLHSAGFVDKDAPPIVGAPPSIGRMPTAGVDMPPDQNTHPLFPPRPDHADVGMNTGIEGGQP